MTSLPTRLARALRRLGLSKHRIAKADEFHPDPAKPLTITITEKR